ncbi:hypothetical protein V9L16_00235 [Pseudomonas tolaasii]|uniref:hypothetical protein n=1 Tax=Pseudomonas tolaasii TaxID=29442 RepID=UPI0030CEF68E
MNQNTEALPEIDIKEFRERFPRIFSDPAVDEIYCDPGWKNLLIAVCEVLQDYLRRHPEVTPVTVAQVKSKFGELHFFYDGGDAFCRGSDRHSDPVIDKNLLILWSPRQTSG